MRTLTATYKGNRVLELTEEVDLPPDAEVHVLILEDLEDEEFDRQLRLAAEQLFAEDWNSEEDEVWNEYLQAT